MCRLILIGLMGSGKSTLGQRLAEDLDRPFLDTDHDVVAQAGGRSIPAQFAEDGEAVFREREAQVIATLLERAPPDAVIAFGGGAICNPDTAARAAAAGIVIWLDPQLPLIAQRLASCQSRPLLQLSGRERASTEPDSHKLLERLRILYCQRYAQYARATLRVRVTKHAVVIGELTTVIPHPEQANATIAAAVSSALRRDVRSELPA